MERKIDPRELERIYSAGGTFQEKVDAYSYLSEIFNANNSDPKKFETALRSEGVADYCIRDIWATLESPQFAKLLRLSEEVKKMRYSISTQADRMSIVRTNDLRSLENMIGALHIYRLYALTPEVEKETFLGYISFERYRELLLKEGKLLGYNWRLLQCKLANVNQGNSSDLERYFYIIKPLEDLILENKIQGLLPPDILENCYKVKDLTEAINSEIVNICVELEYILLSLQEQRDKELLFEIIQETKEGLKKYDSITFESVDKKKYNNNKKLYATVTR